MHSSLSECFFGHSWPKLDHIEFWRSSLRILTQEGGHREVMWKGFQFSEPPSASNGLCEQRKPSGPFWRGGFWSISGKRRGGRQWRRVDESERYLGSPNLQQLVSDWTWGEGAGGIKNNYQDLAWASEYIMIPLAEIKGTGEGLGLNGKVAFTVNPLIPAWLLSLGCQSQGHLKWWVHLQPSLLVSEIHTKFSSSPQNTLFSLPSVLS